MVFGKQGGNVLLHLGVGLLMFGQFVFGDRQLEQRFTWWKVNHPTIR